jgi:uncharacterized protein (UPF0335 family)
MTGASLCAQRPPQAFSADISRRVNSVDERALALTPAPANPNALSRRRAARRPSVIEGEFAMPASSAAEKLEAGEAERANTSFARDQLKAIIERIERLEEEKKATSDDIRDVYAEAKGNGFDVKALRAIIRMRKMDTDERKEQEAVLETYMHALGMLQ